MGGGEKIKPVFLLGGYDLEMLTIKHLLDEHHQRYHDFHLKWGACLSAYKDVFNDQEHFVGIELTEDTELPVNYTVIDHHNEKSHKPSSLEQLAVLLGLELNHYQQLVAANDRGYIPAMEAMGATKKEIEEIRRADRRAQGVTDNIEKLAEKAVKENLLKIGELVMVEALSTGFSPIVDRLYPFESILISYENYFVYYGKGSEDLAYEFRNLIRAKKAYSGGGKNGFFGITEKAFTREETEALKAETINHLIQQQ